MENVAARNKERWHSAQMPRFSQGTAVSKEGQSTPLFHSTLIRFISTPCLFPLSVKYLVKWSHLPSLVHSPDLILNLILVLYFFCSFLTTTARAPIILQIPDTVQLCCDNLTLPALCNTLHLCCDNLTLPARPRHSQWIQSSPCSTKLASSHEPVGLELDPAYLFSSEGC